MECGIKSIHFCHYIYICIENMYTLSKSRIVNIDVAAAKVLKFFIMSTTRTVVYIYIYHSFKICLFISYSIHLLFLFLPMPSFNLIYSFSSLPFWFKNFKKIYTCSAGNCLTLNVNNSYMIGNYVGLQLKAISIFVGASSG